MKKKENPLLKSYIVETPDQETLIVSQYIPEEQTPSAQDFFSSIHLAS